MLALKYIIRSRLFILSVLLFAMLFSYSQDRIREFVKRNAVEIKSIEPSNTRFDDLEAIGMAIGERRIVMLGEQDHGDAPTFLAKTRLIKYLHEQKGFNVLAFESDFFGLTAGWDNPGGRAEIGPFLQGNIFQVWSYCNECKGLLYDYIPATQNSARPLIVAGFDNQLVMDYSTRHLTNGFDSLFTSLRLPVVQNPEYRTTILPLLDSLRLGFFHSLSDSFYIRLNGVLDVLKTQLEGKLRNDSFWVQVLNSLVEGSKTYQLREKDPIASLNARDYSMAQNLKWLTTVKYAKEKIIVWAANGHIAKYIDSTTYGFKKLSIAMGSYFTSDSVLQRQTYVLGFTSNKGRAGRLTSRTFTIPPAKPNTFEGWMDSSYKYAFINFQFSNNSAPDERFLLKGIGHYNFGEYWTRIFDGIFYIRDMYPCNQ